MRTIIFTLQIFILWPFLNMSASAKANQAEDLDKQQQKIDLLVELASEDKDKKHLVYEALKKARAIQYKKGEYNALFLMGKWQKGDSSILLYQQAYAIALKNESIGSRSKCLFKIGLTYFKQDTYDSAIFYYREAIKIEEKNNNERNLASIYKNIGSTFHKASNYDSSIHYYQEALQIYLNASDDTKVAQTLLSLGITYKDLGEFEQALEYSLDAVRLLEKYGAKKHEASCYNNIGLIYNHLKDFEKSLFYHHKALALRRELKLENRIAHSLNNIGIVYQNNKSYKEALQYFTESLEVKEKLKNKSRLSTTYNNIGQVYFLLLDYQKAEIYYKKSIAIDREYNDSERLTITLNQLGELYLTTRQYTKSNECLEEAAGLAEEMGTQLLIQENLEYRMALAAAVQDFEGAYRLSLSYNQVKDSILNKEKTESLYEMQTKYETEKKEKDIEILKQQEIIQKAQLKTQQNWIYTLFSAVFITIVYVVFLRRNFLKLKKAKQKIQFLHRELNHRVKNNLQILSSIFSLQADHFKDEQIVEAIKSGESRVNAMALIHQKLYLDEDIQEVNLKAYVTELVNYLVKIYGFGSQDELKLELTLDDILISVDKAIPMGLIINELVSNALKYAFTDHPDPLLKVTVIKGEKGLYSLQVKDNGNKPIPKEKVEKKKKPSFGLKMVNILVQQLNGTMEVSNSAGQAYSLQFS